MPGAAAERLGKKVALGAWDWDFASAGVPLNSSYGPLQYLEIPGFSKRGSRFSRETQLNELPSNTTFFVSQH
ncbi:unnamed protein product [Coccothraustes coccothraustes]